VKLITAVLAPDKLDAVAAALAEADVYRMTVTECRGVVRNADGAPRLAEKVRLEIAVNENFVQPTIEAIQSVESLAVGLLADGSVAPGEEQDVGEDLGFGKIFVSDLLDVVRIRTGERGPDAI
jgi:nitrogen regulatory protein P-II 1